MTDVGERVILHADMDAFYAAIEQRDRPELAGRPVIVGGQGPRGVVATASYEARKFGVHSAMPGARARKLCPDGVFVAPRMSVYAEASRKVRAVFDSYTPEVEPLSLDEAFLDVTGSQRLFGSGVEIAEGIRRDVHEATGLTVSVGVAATKFVAKVASDLDKPDGLVVVPVDVCGFLAPLPVRRLWGAGPKMQERLRSLGMKTIGDLQQVRQEHLVNMLGERVGEHFWRLAHGLDPRPVETDRDARSVSHETTFQEDLWDRDRCHSVLFELTEMVARRLRQQGLTARTVRVKLRHGDFTTLSRQRRIGGAGTDDDRALFEAVRALFDGAWPGQPGLRLLGVAAADLRTGRGAAQGELFGADGVPGPGDEVERRSLLDAMDAIRDRFGEDAIRHAGSGRSVADDRGRVAEPDPRSLEGDANHDDSAG